MWLSHLAWLCKSRRVARDHPLHESLPVGNLDVFPIWISQGSWTSDGIFSFSERESENSVFFLKLSMKLATVRPVQNQRGEGGNTCASNSVSFWCEGWWVQGVAGLAVFKCIDQVTHWADHDQGSGPNLCKEGVKEETATVWLEEEQYSQKHNASNI